MPSKEVKKLVQAGYTGVAVVVPSFWRKYFDLKKGDEILVECNGQMIVTPIPKDKEDKTKKKGGKNEK